MADSYLTMVNDVLVRLRQPQVSTVAESTYSSFIGALVNQAKREVEDAWDWSSLFRVLPVTTVAATDTYELLIGRGEIKYVHNVTQKFELRPIQREKLDTLIDFGNATSGAPIWWRMSGVNGSNNPTVQLWPNPDAVYTINFYTKVPTSDLLADADTVRISKWPIVLGAYSRAVSERGEDGGQSFDETRSEYLSALNDAISFDQTLTGTHDWFVADTCRHHFDH